MYVEIPLVAGQFASIWAYEKGDWCKRLVQRPHCDGTADEDHHDFLRRPANVYASKFLRHSPLTASRGQRTAALQTTWSISLGWGVDHLYFCIIPTSVCMLACWRRPELDQIKDIAIAYCCNQGHCGLLVHWTSHVSSVLESIKRKLKSVCDFHLFHFNNFFHFHCCLSSRFPNS